jgi:hypothetical protein
MLFPGAMITRKKFVLFHLCATPLDQNDQHDDKKHPGDNPDNHGSVHFNSPFSQWLKSF